MKIISSIFAGLILLLLATSSVYAAKICPAGSIFGSLCSINAEGNLVSGLITLFFIITIIISIIYLIWGGIKWITSGGDKASLHAAREHVVAAVVGLAIVFLVYFILSFVLTAFGLSGFSWNIPTL